MSVQWKNCSSVESVAWGKKIISIGFSVLCAVVGTTVFVWGWPPSSLMPMRTSAAVGFQQTTQRMPLVLRIEINSVHFLCVWAGFCGFHWSEESAKRKTGCFNEDKE